MYINVYKKICPRIRGACSLVQQSYRAGDHGFINFPSIRSPNLPNFSSLLELRL